MMMSTVINPNYLYLGSFYRKLRPADRFDHELAAARGWEYDDV